MISVVLYGRNDSHGYNLHKRGAISLNCIAEMLNDADDEIIFVDYNSPDQIPTFPEAIADTLTDKAAKLLRIIRVREDYHRQFASDTHLVALESQSRNIASRRANKANRWILSTNTDMIFLPRQSNRNLNDCIGALEDGFYHLPRFEIPENLWELFDRRDPAAAIARVQEWGRTLHLNEIVYGGYDNVFEAPGDFQLFLREDLERIGGFDETMIRGWHVDSNIARRMKLLRGEVRSAAEQVFGYHCGHTRQPTSLHRSGFVANSLDTYVRDVVDPVLHGQLLSWGAPEIAFEERRLGGGCSAQMEAALVKAIPAAGPETSQVAFNEATFDSVNYHPSHVLPHLVNLLSELPHGQTLLLLGTDEDLFRQLSVALGGLGLKPRILWADGPPGCNFAECVSLDQGIARADLFVLQFSVNRDEPSDELRNMRWQSQRALEQIIANEQLRALGRRRLIVLINAGHTPLQATFQSAMTYTAIPFTARLRHGFVTLPPPDRVPKPRRADFHDDDIAMVRNIARQSHLLPGWERMALDLPAMVDQGRMDRSEPAVERLLKQASEHVEASKRRCAESPVPALGRDTSASRLCSASDWENPAWFDVVDRCYSGNQIYVQGGRSRWAWERAGLVHNLRANVSEFDRPWVLVVCSGPDHLPAFVAHYGYRVAYTTYAELLSGDATNNDGWPEQLTIWHMINHADIVPVDQARARGVDRFAAVLIAGTDVTGAGAERFKAVGARLEALAADDAFVSVAVQVHLNQGQGRALSFREWQAADQPGGILDAMGLHPVGPFDASIPLDCAVRFAHEDETQYVSGLSFGWGSSMVTIGLINGARSPQRPSFRTAPPVQMPMISQADAGLDEMNPAIPAPVQAAVRAAMCHSFACRIVSGLPRNLTRFARHVVTDDGLGWHIVSLQQPSSEPIMVNLASPPAFVALIDQDGQEISRASLGFGANGLRFLPAEAGSRFTLVYATPAEADAAVAVG